MLSPSRVGLLSTGQEQVDQCRLLHPNLVITDRKVIDWKPGNPSVMPKGPSNLPRRRRIGGFLPGVPRSWPGSS